MFLLLGVHNPSPEEQIVFYSAAKEHNITIVTTIVSDHLPWSHTDPHSKAKRGAFGQMEGTGVQILAVPLLSQGTYDHSTRVSWEEFNKGTLDNDAGRHQGKQQGVDFQVIPELAIAGREDIMTSRPEGARWGEVHRTWRGSCVRGLLDKSCDLQ